MTPLQQAHIAGILATRPLSRQERKARGQFMTPPAIATFMAERAVRQLTGDCLRILEPAAGAGVLAAAAVDALLRLDAKPARIELLLFESDVRLLPALRDLCARLQRDCAALGVCLTSEVEICDFLLSPLARGQVPDIDLVIANPPYFKIGKDDARAVAHEYAVHGQPNIYGLFMACCASLLRTGGQFCFITPRSWLNGTYFGAVRRRMLQRLDLSGLHLFGSRTDHFTADEVLQEAIITWGRTAAGDASIRISNSQGITDLATARYLDHPVDDVVGVNVDRLITLPEANSVIANSGLDDTLASLGLKVSTGPVVAFRAAEHLRTVAAPQTVPLLWLQHVKTLTVQWPIQKKREHIEANAASAWMLLPNRPMVLLRRFSPKEDHRRVTASAYLGELPGSGIGLENHLNYIHRPAGELSAAAARGLAAYLNCRQVDAYFRTVSGNTQINAGELRRLPFPAWRQLEQIGEQMGTSSDLAVADAAIDQVLGWGCEDARLQLMHA